MMKNRTAGQGKLKLISSALILFALLCIMVWANISVQSASVSKGTVNVSSTIDLTVTWTGENASFFACEDATCNGCDQTVNWGCLCNQSLTANENQPLSSTCTYTVPAEVSSSTKTFYYTLYNGSGHKYGPYAGATFNINHKPTVSNVLISPTSANVSSTFTCSYSYADQDSDSEYASGVEYRWYQNRSGSWAQLSACSQQTLSSGDCSNTFNVDDYYMCSVRAYDEHLVGSDFTNSSSVLIDANRAPNITSIDLPETTISQRINQGSDLTITASWKDTGDSVRFIMCNSSSINSNGCAAGSRTMINSTYYSTSPATLSYTVNASDLTNQSFSILACDDENLCSGVMNYSFYANHPPTVDSVNLSGDMRNSLDYAYDSANLYCSIENLNDTESASPYLDLEQYYIYWELNRSSAITTYYAPNSTLMTHGNTQEGDKWRCVIKPYDNFTVSETNYTSDWLLISSDGGAGSQPKITSIWDSSTESNPTNSGDIIEFKISWTDSDSDEFNIYICNTSQINKTGCQNYIFKEERNLSKTFSERTNVSFEYTVEDAIANNNLINSTGYWVSVCDHTGGLSGDWLCSNYGPWGDIDNPMGNITVNHLPQITNANIITDNNSHYPDEDSNLICNVSATDNMFDYYGGSTSNSIGLDNDSFHYKWYLNRGNGYQLYEIPSTKILTHSNTLYEDKWICEVTPNDGYANGTGTNSSEMAIDVSTSWLIPSITRVTDNSSNDTPTVAGNDVLFNIYWSDYDSDSLALFICNSTNITKSGCIDKAYYENISHTSANPLTGKYTTEEDDSTNMSYYVMVCDSTGGIGGDWKCSDIYNGSSFYTVHKPNITSVNLGSISSNISGNLTQTYYNNFTETDNLFCNISVSDKENDSIYLDVAWMRKRQAESSFSTYFSYSLSHNATLSAYNVSAYLTHANIFADEEWYCNVSARDKYGKGSHYVSETVLIKESTYTSDTKPYITSYSISNDASNPINVGSVLPLSISWQDYDSGSVRLFACKTPNMNISGCFDGIVYEGNLTTDNPIEINYIPNETDYTNQSISFMICDESNVETNCSYINTTYVYVNHMPTTYNTFITAYDKEGNADPDNKSKSYLTCNYSYDPDSDQIDSFINDSLLFNDTESSASFEFEWHIKDENQGNYTRLIGLTNRTISNEAISLYDRDDRLFCSIRSTDNYGLASGHVNSSVIIINNSAPVVNGHITPMYPNATNNLTCNYNVTEYDGEDYNVTISWHYINASEFSPAVNNDVLFSSRINDGDNIYCNITATDGRDSESNITLNKTMGLTIPPDSPIITYPFNDTPSIHSTTVLPEVIEDGANLTFYAFWNDTNQTRYGGSGELADMFVCSTSGISRWGCYDEMYCSADDHGGDNVSCTWNNFSSDTFENEYYLMVCDDSGFCSDPYHGKFYRNTRPTSSNIDIDPDLAYAYDNLTCTYDYSDPDNHPENTDMTEYSWERYNASTSSWDSVGTSELLIYNESSMTHGSGDIIRCGIKVYDTYNLSDSEYRYSGNLSIYNSAPEVTFINPLDGSYYDSSINFSWSYIDSDEDTQTFYLKRSTDNLIYNDLYTGSNTFYYYNTSSLTTGRYYFKIYSYDGTNFSLEEVTNDPIRIGRCDIPGGNTWTISNNVSYCTGRTINSNIIINSSSQVMFANSTINGNITIYSDGSELRLENTNATSITYIYSQDAKIIQLDDDSIIFTGNLTGNISNSIVNKTAYQIHSNAVVEINDTTISNISTYESSKITLHNSTILSLNAYNLSTIDAGSRSNIINITHLSSGSSGSVKITGYNNLTDTAFISISSGSDITREYHIRAMGAGVIPVANADFKLYNNTINIANYTSDSNGILAFNRTYSTANLSEDYDVFYNNKHTTINLTSEYEPVIIVNEVNCTGEDNWVINTFVSCSNRNIASNSITVTENGTFYVNGSTISGTITFADGSSSYIYNSQISTANIMNSNLKLNNTRIINTVLSETPKIHALSNSSIYNTQFLNSSVTEIHGFINLNMTSLEDAAAITRSYPVYLYDQAGNPISGEALEFRNTSGNIIDSANTSSTGYVNLTASYSSDNTIKIYYENSPVGAVSIDTDTRNPINLSNGTRTINFTQQTTETLHYNYQTYNNEDIMDFTNLSHRIPASDMMLIIKNSNGSFQVKLPHTDMLAEVIDIKYNSSVIIDNSTIGLGAGRRYVPYDTAAFEISNLSEYALVGFNYTAISDTSKITIFKIGYNFSTGLIDWSDITQYNNGQYLLKDGMAWINISSFSVFVLAQDTYVAPVYTGGGGGGGSSRRSSGGGGSYYVSSDKNDTNDTKKESQTISKTEKGYLLEFSLSEPVEKIDYSMANYDQTLKTITIYLGNGRTKGTLEYIPELQNNNNEEGRKTLYSFNLIPAFSRSDITKTTFTFRVPLNWFIKNNRNKESIKMYSYDDNTGQWSELITRHINDYGQDALYSADSFSGNKYMIVSTNTEQEHSGNQNSGNTQPEIQKPADTRKSNFAYIIIIIVLSGAIIGMIAFAVQRKNHPIEDSFINKSGKIYDSDKKLNISDMIFHETDERPKPLNLDSYLVNTEKKHTVSLQTKAEQAKVSSTDRPAQKIVNQDKQAGRPKINGSHSTVIGNTETTAKTTTTSKRTITRRITAAQYDQALSILDDYIKQAVRRKKSLHEIQIDLITAGWPHFIVNEALATHISSRKKR